MHLTPASKLMAAGEFSFIIQLEYGTLFSLSGTLTVLGTTTVLMLTGTLIFVFVSHRAGIERERQAQLQTANQKLRESEAALEQRVEERTRELKLAKEEAEIARRHAEQADHVKSQFLASMSHELRTPLNAILNFTEFVNLEMFGPINERQKDALTKSLESGRHLHSLINDV